MKQSFKSETPQYKTGQAITPYQQAQQEWDNRIGSAVSQAQNWRFVGVLSLVIALILLVLLIVSLAMDKDHIFVAQVTKAGRVVNVLPLSKGYQPSDAQKEYFLGHFIELVRTIPLDPVLAKRNWVSAYHFLTQRSSKELNASMQEYDPTALLGKKTVTVTIDDMEAMSDNTYHIDWTETSMDLNGQNRVDTHYSGVFSVMISPPKTQEAILQNPLGIYIVDFHISKRET